MLYTISINTISMEWTTNLNRNFHSFGKIIYFSLCNELTEDKPKFMPNSFIKVTMNTIDC